MESANAKMAAKGYLDSLGFADRIVRRLEKIVDKVRFASYGYAGFFDLIKVKEEELDKLYQFDASLLEDADRLKNKIGELGSALDTQDRAREKLEELEALVDEVEQKITGRDDLIRGIR